MARHALSQPGVEKVDTVLGPYDAVVTVSTRDFAELSELARRARSCPGIRTSLTCPVARTDNLCGRERIASLAKDLLQTRKRREVITSRRIYSVVDRVYASVELTNAPCQPWYQTAPLKALTESMPEIWPSFVKWNV
jgi:Lrp/AsnC ligand binding domain